MQVESDPAFGGPYLQALEQLREGGVEATRSTRKTAAAPTSAGLFVGIIIFLKKPSSRRFLFMFTFQRYLSQSSLSFPISRTYIYATATATTSAQTAAAETLLAAKKAAELQTQEEVVKLQKNERAELHSLQARLKVMVTVIIFRSDDIQR